jgi:hypothetical protein
MLRSIVVSLVSRLVSGVVSVCAPLCLRRGMFVLSSVLPFEELVVTHISIPILGARGTVGNIMLALSLLYRADVRRYCHTSRLLGHFKLEGFRASFVICLHTTLPSARLLTRNHDNDDNIASSHSALLFLSFAVAASPRTTTLRQFITMGQCIYHLHRRDAAVDAPVSEQLEPAYDLQEHMSERTPRDASHTARLREVRPRRTRQWRPLAGRLTGLFDELQVQQRQQ